MSVHFDGGEFLEDPFLLSLKILVVFLLVFGNAFFVAAEFSIVKMRSSRLDVLIAEGNRRASYAKKLADRLDVALSVTQLGITIVSLGLGWLGEPVVASLLHPAFSWFGVPESAVETVSFAIAFFLITSLHIVGGELIPKNVAIRKVESVALTVALPLLVFQRIMYPFVWLLNHVANWAEERMGFSVVTKEEDVAHTEEEIRVLMEESHRQGFIDKTELEFVDNVFDFADLSVREIMIPRTDMVCLDLEDSVEESIETAMEERLTRYPICDGGKDNVIGFLHIKDFLQTLYKKETPDLRKLARHALVVPEAMAVSRLLQTMQQERSQLAIVVDEYGGTAGMVTIEDVIEEIVGDIQDEFDTDRPLVEKKGACLYSVDAKMLLEELEDILEVAIDEEEIDSVGGWLSAHVDNPPRIGQKAAFGDAQFFVEETEGVRITRVLCRLGREPQKEHDEIVDLTQSRKTDGIRYMNGRRRDGKGVRAN
ncbi:hemolysin family protein [Selenomonas sputigena]|uniref:hemolysin family protein n=1 Tax=Selenomonas sputigena TaxID=69823 RepID=UPI00222E1E4E|nr:hemolysin family protein [Selenomonas sputigena]UZD42277.1 hemolysin family protein [Selenomonas sputigena]